MIDVNRIATESLFTFFLMSFCGQVCRFLYGSQQINYALYLAVKLFILALAVLAIYRIKKNSDFAEIVILSALTFGALWNAN